MHCGGESAGGEGYFIKPTLFTDVNANMKIVKEEIFGPVGAVIKFEDEQGISVLTDCPSVLTFFHYEDIIKKANDSTYGLAAYVFSQNITRAIESAHKLKAGSVWVNSGSIVSTNVPFGGYKQSGIGREMGEYALQE